jgi:hypothetical protein
LPVSFLFLFHGIFYNILNGDDQVDKHLPRLSVKIMWLYLAASVTLRQLD